MSADHGPGPVRTCVACRLEGAKRSLVRLARPAGGLVTVDLSGHAQGRGAYLHPDPGCIDLARRRRSLERALKAQVPEAVWEELAVATHKEADLE